MVKKVLLCFSLLFLIIISTLSTCLFYIQATYYSNNRSSWVDEQELEAINYIKSHLLPNESVLAFSEYTMNTIKALVCINPLQNAYKWNNILTGTTNPYIITYILSSSNIRYIYIPNRDWENLISSRGTFDIFLNFFQKVFENERVRVYEVPVLNPSI